MQRFRLMHFGLLGTVLLAGVLAGCSASRETATRPAAVPESVVAVIGDEMLTLEQFEERYARTVGSRQAAADDSAAALREFLDRYVTFRLKVLAAESAGMDTTAQIRKEIETYRLNLARPYLLDQEVIDPVVRTIYERQQEVVDVSHILLRVAPDAAPADTF